jgi:hypothetical protein
LRWAAALAALVACWAAPAASAAGPATLGKPFALLVDHAGDRVYWTNQDNSISWASLDASVSSQLNTTGASVVRPTGLTLDPGTGRLYWANVNGDNTNIIAFARTDDSGGANVPTPGAPRENGVGVAIADTTIFWAYMFNISSMSLTSGVVSAFSPTGTGSHEAFGGVAFDPVGRRLYWTNTKTNDDDNTIASANLNGSGSEDLPIPAGALVSDPSSPSIDPTARRIYWVNNALYGSGQGHSISFASLDPAHPGGGTLQVPGSAGVQAVAVDPVTSRICWASQSTSTEPAAVRCANPDGSDVKMVFPAPVDTSLHVPVIDDAPPSSTPLTDASFLYHAIDKDLALSCALDNAAPAACTGRSSFSKLAVGRHCFTVREQRSGAFGPSAQACWTVTQLAPGCTAGFHHGYFISASAATLARRQVVFHATSDGVAGRVSLRTRTSVKDARVTYKLDGKALGTRATTTLAFSQIDRTRSHTLTVEVAAGGRRTRITRHFKYVSFVAVACGGRTVIGRIAPRTARLGGARVTISAQVPKEISGTTKLRFLVKASKPHLLRAAHFTFAGKALTQHALSAALTTQQLSANGSQTITIELVPVRGRSVTLRIAFRTRST